MSRAFSHTIKQILLIGAILIALLVILCRVKNSADCHGKKHDV